MGRLAPSGPLSRAEFDALPQSIQRKYFSSVERLRIADQDRNAALQAEQTAQANIRIRPPSSEGLSFFARLRKEGRLRMFGGSTAPNERSLSTEEAKWYLSLPEKVRRNQFSRDEQIALTKACATLLVDGLIPYRFFVRRQKRRDQKDDLLDDGDESAIESDSDDENPPIKARDSFQLDQLTQYDVAECGRQMRRQATLRKMSSGEPRHRRSNTASSGSSASFVPFPPEIRKAPPLMTGPPPSVPRSEHGAIHYQNPEARKKLRQYLANPQKLDEAIEFGFPAANKSFFIDSTARIGSTSETIAPVTNPIPARKPSFGSAEDNGPSTFFTCSDSASVGSGASVKSVDDDLSPITPRYRIGSVPFQNQDLEGTGESIESQYLGAPGGGVPLQPIIDEVRKNSGASLSATAAAAAAAAAKAVAASAPDRRPEEDGWSDLVGPENREMTLRMTLTRPDLRSDEEHIYAYQQRGSLSRGSGKQSKPSSKAGSKPGSAGSIFQTSLNGDSTETVAGEARSQGRLVKRLVKRIKG